VIASVENEIMIQQKLLHWYQTNARILPWRINQDSYRVWISEIMLQQTRVEAVIDYYNQWMLELPTLADLANVADDKLYKLWQGLGYYTRAKNLKKAAGIIIEQYSGVIPSDESTLMMLPGIGPYTAGAISSIAYGQKVAAIDGNVMRVVSRIYGFREDIGSSVAKEQIKQRVYEMLPDSQVGSFNQSLMELGATICVPNGKPLCSNCPIRDECIAYKEQLTDIIPFRTPKKERKIQPITVFLIQIGPRWVMRKRPTRGLLANLWEFPTIEGSISMEEAPNELNKLGIDIISIEEMIGAKHIFTHIEWHMRAFFVKGHLIDELMPNCIIASTNEISSLYSVPTAFSAYLKIIYGQK
jgi:A/G-specific adenine glycosylase